MTWKEEEKEPKQTFKENFQFEIHGVCARACRYMPAYVIINLIDCIIIVYNKYRFFLT